MDYFDSTGFPGGWEGSSALGLGGYPQFGASPSYPGNFSLDSPLSDSALFPMYGEQNNSPNIDPQEVNSYGFALPFNSYFPLGAEEEESSDELP